MHASILALKTQIAPAVVVELIMKFKKVSDTYYNPKDTAGYAGASKILEKFPKARKWLTAQPTYTLHKPMRRRFQTRMYRVAGPNQLWQMDLLEMIPYARVNNSYRYILTCIDVFSRYARAEPLKAKDANSVGRAIENMFKSGIRPHQVQTDLGKEFYNKTVRTIFLKHKIKHYSVHSQFKAALVERFNRTLREKLNRYFTHQGNKIWIKVLSDIIDTYNKTPHRGINKRRPIDIYDTNDIDNWLEQEERRHANRKIKPHPINSFVRISRISTSPFRKNFNQNWSEEVFQINAIDKRDRPLMYVLKDINGEIIQGKFYHEEIQVISDQPTIYRIEKVIKTRGKGKHKQYLVKWLNYDNSHNSWISNDQFTSHY